MEEATSSLLSILQDILAGSTVGASTGVTGISSNVRNETDLGVKDANVEAETSPQGELQADMTDMTPKRPSESAEVEVKRPRMADECLGDEKSIVFLVENHGILPIHYETSTDSIVLHHSPY